MQTSLSPSLRKGSSCVQISEFIAEKTLHFIMGMKTSCPYSLPPFISPPMPPQKSFKLTFKEKLFLFKHLHLLSTLTTTIVSETSFKISSPTPFSSTNVLSCKLIVSALLKTLTTELGIFCVTFFSSQR